MEYVVDGTILFIKEYTGRKLTGYRIPSYKDQQDSTDISFHINAPIATEFTETKLRPATEEEYNEWRMMDRFDRSQCTTVYPQSVIFGNNIIIEGVTVQYVFDWENNPLERTPFVTKTSFSSLRVSGDLIY